MSSLPDTFRADLVVFDGQVFDHETVGQHLKQALHDLAPNGALVYSNIPLIDNQLGWSRFQDDFPELKFIEIPQSRSGIAVSNSSDQSNLNLDHAFIDSVRKEHEKLPISGMEEIWQSLGRNPDLGEGKRILLYPASRYLMNFVSFVDNVDENAPEIISFIDDNFEGDLASMGLSVKRPKQFSAKDFDAVVIGSHKFGKELHENCLNFFGPHCKIIDLIEYQVSMKPLIMPEVRLHKVV